MTVQPLTPELPRESKIREMPFNPSLGDSWSAHFATVINMTNSRRKWSATYGYWLGRQQVRRVPITEVFPEGKPSAKAVDFVWIVQTVR